MGYPLGQIQSQGRTHGVMAQTVVPWRAIGIPLWAYDAWVARGVDWLAMSEDLPRADNRVTVGPRRPHPPALPAEQPARRTRGWSRRRKRMLRRLGFWMVDDALAPSREHDAPVRHAGASAPTRATSVLDPFCRTHDVENLFVVDASFFPSSAAVNPALTIVAQALRVADHIRATDLRH